jgi:predicted dehydrogenase
MSVIRVALIGCGGFVHHTHLTNLTENEKYQIHATVDINLPAAQDVAESGGAAYWTDDADRVFSDDGVELVFIATPHHTHADLTIRAARAGKHVYCEKPMALDEAGCQAVITAVEKAGVKYMAGYNRAVAPFTLEARALLAELAEPMMIYHRFADWNPYSHGWLIDENLSGGRLVGEAGHALDSMCQLVGEDPIRVYAEGGNYAEPSPTQAPDSAIITLGFPSGSTGTLFMSSVGNNGFPKEEVQITCADHTIVNYGYQRLEIHGPNGKTDRELPQVDKGLMHMLDAMFRVVRHDAVPPVGLREALRASRCTYAAVRAIRTRELQHL